MLTCSLYMFQVGFLGLCGKRVDSIDYYKQRMMELDKRVIHSVTFKFFECHFFIFLHSNSCFVIFFFFFFCESLHPNSFLG